MATTTTTTTSSDLPEPLPLGGTALHCIAWQGGIELKDLLGNKGANLCEMTKLG